MGSNRRPAGSPPLPLVAELREERLAAGLSQSQIPGLARQTVCQMENGRHDPRAETLIIYAAGLGYDVILEPDD